MSCGVQCDRVAALGFTFNFVMVVVQVSKPRFLPWEGVVVCSGDCYTVTTEATLRDAFFFFFWFGFGLFTTKFSSAGDVASCCAAVCCQILCCRAVVFNAIGLLHGGSASLEAKGFALLFQGVGVCSGDCYTTISRFYKSFFY